MPFTRYIRTVALTLFLCAFSFILLVLFQIGAPTKSSVWINEIYKIKTQAALSITQPKLVLAGGSDILYGISCKTISEELNIPCVNGGTNAGLGVEYLLHTARSWIQPGDTALISFTYDAYLSNGKPEKILIDYVLSRDSQYLPSMDWVTKIRVFTGITFSRIIEGYAAKISTPPVDLTARHQAETLNSFGDETMNYEPERIQKYANHIKTIKADDRLKGYQHSTYGMRKIREFADWCKQNDVRLLITYPNTLRFEEYEDDQQKAFFQSIEDFHKELDIPIIGQYSDFMYDASMLFDTRYHLNGRGVDQRTEAVVKLIEPLLAES